MKQNNRVLGKVVLAASAAVMAVGLINSFDVKAEVSSGYVLVNCQGGDEMGCLPTTSGADCGGYAACPPTL